MKILLFIILLIFGLPALFVWYMGRKLKNTLQKARQQQYGARGNNSNNGSGYHREEPEHQGRVFSDIEEDAEFEAVEGPRREMESPTRVEHEEQVTDAEFEEIK